MGRKRTHSASAVVLQGRYEKVGVDCVQEPFEALTLQSLPQVEAT